MSSKTSVLYLTPKKIPTKVVTCTCVKLVSRHSGDKPCLLKCQLKCFPLECDSRGSRFLLVLTVLECPLVMCHVPNKSTTMSRVICHVSTVVNHRVMCHVPNYGNSGLHRFKKPDSTRPGPLLSAKRLGAEWELWATE